MIKTGESCCVSKSPLRKIRKTEVNRKKEKLISSPTKVYSDRLEKSYTQGIITINNNYRDYYYDSNKFINKVVVIHVMPCDR